VFWYIACCWLFWFLILEVVDKVAAELHNWLQ
jgi:hypothetical protein